MALPPHLAELESRLASRLDEVLGGYRRAMEERLRAATVRLVSEASEVPAPTLDGILAELRGSTLDAVPRQEGARAALARLLDDVRAVDLAESQVAVLETLLVSGRDAADRLALYLVRDAILVPFRQNGFDEPFPEGRELDWSGSLAERLVDRRGCVRLDADSAAELAPQLGFGGRGAAVVVPLVLRDRIAALVWADRLATEPELPLLQLLVAFSAQRLELQALSQRTATPTLYANGEAPGEPLPLWSLAPAAALFAAPEVEEMAEPEWTPLESAAELGTEESGEAPIAFVEVDATPSAESLAPMAPTVPAAPTLWEPFASPAAERDEPAFAAAADEADQVAELWEPEPEALPVESEPAPAPPPFASLPLPPLPELDVLGTVRMPILSFPPAGGLHPSEETTAPLRVDVAKSLEGAASTHEFPAPGLEAPPEAALEAPEIDVNEDATVLTQRFPVGFRSPAPAVAPPPAAEDPNDRTASRSRSTEVAAPADLSGPGLAFMTGRATRRTAVDQPLHEEAKRLARLLVSEIKLYNEEQVLEGRRNRDIYHRLKDDIDRSRQIYEERIDASVRGSTDYFQQELVRSLAGGDPRAMGI